MAPAARLAYWLAIPAVLRSLLVAAEVGVHDGSGLFSFITRPDIKAPKWNVTVHDAAALTDGYWFFGPYEILAQPKNTGHGWVGPHIYDQNGELIWSGVEMFDNRNIEDFRISNVAGEDLMTLMWQEKGQGILLDNSYQKKKAIQFDSPRLFNSHEFHFVANGTRAIVSTKKSVMATASASREAGFQGGGNCNVWSDGFREYDTRTWKKTFEWHSFGPVPLTESTFNENLQNDCRMGWDYFHINSVDKTKDGDYWVSGRHTDALYLISGKDGSIIWRVGGHAESDFKLDDEVKFARQHDIRIREENDTHTIISILDNAKGMYDTQTPTYRFSRALVLSLQTVEPRSVSIIQQIDHPHGQGSYAPRRGNFQTLENGNLFIGWSEQALQTEHTADGTLIMEAQLQPDWLGTYRSYKFPFVGRPKEDPAVYAVAHDEADNNTSTRVHVSWNGATEVATWNLCKTTKGGANLRPLLSAPRSGFETAINYDGFATYVVLQAVDRDGQIIGESGIVKTIPPNNMNTPAVLEEQDWIQKTQMRRIRVMNHAMSLFSSPIITFILGFAFSVALMMGIYLMKQRLPLGRVRQIKYHAIRERDLDNSELTDTFHKRSMSSANG